MDALGVSGGAGQGDAADGLGEQAADGVDVVVVDLEVEELAELVQGESGGDAVGAGGDFDDLGQLGVVLVGELADDLLQEVLHGDQAGSTAVLVDGQGHVEAAGLHLAQEVVGGLHLGDVLGVPGESGHGEGLVLGVGGQASQDVLEVEDAAHVVGVLPDDGHARVAGADEQAHGGGGGLVGVDGDHVGAWDHDLAHEGLAELDDRAHHLAVLVLDGVSLADLVDHLAQVLVDGLAGLGVSGGRLGAAGSGDEAALRGGQDIDPGEQATQGEQGGGGVAPAVGAWGEADDDAQQDDVGQQGQGQDLPPGAHEPGGGQGDENGGEHVDGDAGDAEGAQDPGAVLGQAADPDGAAAALLDEVVGGGAGEAQQGGLAG